MFLCAHFFQRLEKVQHPKTTFSFHRLFLLSTNEHISILAFSFQSRQPVSSFPFQPIRGWLNWLLCPLRGWKDFWLLCRARSSLSHCPSLHLPLSLSPSPPLTHTHTPSSPPLEQTFHYLSLPVQPFDGFVFPYSSSTNPLRLIGSTPQLECWDGSTDLSTAVFTKKKQKAEIILILQDILK